MLFYVLYNVRSVKSEMVYLCFSVVLRLMCLVLGITVEQDNKQQYDKSARVIVANCVTRFDYIALHLVTGCVTVSYNLALHSNVTVFIVHSSCVVFDNL